jgi:hypothetical protein
VSVRELYDLWREPDDPSWFALSNRQQERWLRFAIDLNAAVLAELGAAEAFQSDDEDLIG